MSLPRGTIMVELSTEDRKFLGTRPDGFGGYVELKDLFDHVISKLKELEENQTVILKELKLGHYGEGV